MKANSIIAPRFLRVSILLYLGVLISCTYYNVAGMCHRNVANIAVLPPTLLFLIALEYWATRTYNYTIPRKMAVALLVIRIALYEVVYMTDCSGFSSFLYLIIPFTAYFSLGPKASYALGLLYLAIYMRKLTLGCESCSLAEDIGDILLMTIGMVFSVSMASVIRDEAISRDRAEHLLQELEHSNHRLQAYAGQVAELAATEERNRLARDIHDSLGHYLTVINIQLEKAIAYRRHNPQESEQAVLDAKRTAREALHDVRQSVSTLRTSPEAFSLKAALATLVERMGSNGYPVHLHWQGEETHYPKPVLMTLFRAAQEGLTNAHKHAQPGRVEVYLTLGAEEARLQVCDDGQGFEPAVLDHLSPHREERFGLQGLQERLELVGGRLHIHSQPPNGTQLEVSIPRKHR